MAVKKIINNPEQNEPVKKRGRPKGATDKTERKKRTDKISIQVATPGKNSITTSFGMTLYSLPEIDVNNPESVNARIMEYFSLCEQYDVKPSVASLAMAFSVSRFILFNWLNGRTEKITNSKSMHLIKKAYDYIGSLYETYLNNGSVNPVSCFFLMKNNYGYKDVTDYVVSNNTEQLVNLTEITSRAGLLSE